MVDDHPIEVRDCRKRDFFLLDNVIIDHYASIIGPYPILVYVSLCRHADSSTRESYPSHEFLAKELRVSRATVKRAISTLIAHRLIGRKHRRSKSGDPDTNIYIILEPWGRVSQTPPIETVNMDETIPSVEVGSVGAEVGSVGTEGRVSQNPGVGSVGATNKTQYEQDSLNKKETPTEEANASSSPQRGDAGEPAIKPKRPRAPRKPKDIPTYDQEGYERFLAAYPRRKGLDAALKAWDTLKPDHDLQALMLADIPNRVANDDGWIRGYIPWPGKYLNERRWRDDIVPRHARASPSKPGPTHVGLQQWLEDEERKDGRTDASLG